MNIWIFNHYATIPSLPGGTRHFDLARELVRRGHKVTIFASAISHHGNPKVHLPKAEKWMIQDIEGVHFVWIRTPMYERNDWRRIASMVMYMWRSWRIGRRLGRAVPDIRKPDVIIGSSVHLLAVLAAHWVSRAHGAKFVMEVRDLWPQTLVDMGALGPRHPLTKLLQWLERFLYKRAQKIITLLPLAHEYICAKGIPAEKIVWLPNGIDLALFSSYDQAPEEHDEFTAMYVGAHGEANALEVLLKAAGIVRSRAHSELRFVLVGSGSKKIRLKELAEEQALDNVEFWPPVTKSQLAHTLTKADVLLFHLRASDVFQYGISSNKLFDYMAASRPIVFAAAAGNNPVRDADSGLTVSPEDPEALADAVIALSQTPNKEREVMGRRGREYVEKHHSMSVLAERLEAMLRSLCEGGASER